MIEVTIQECYGDRRTTTLKARTNDLGEAVQRAINKGYGKGSYFCRENEISVGADALAGSQYGQIGRKCSTGGTSLITGRVLISAERVRVRRKPTTQFLKFVGSCAINGHSAALYIRDTGQLALRHESHGKQSKLTLSFRDQAHYDDYIESKGTIGAQLLNEVLGDLGVDGFPATTGFEG